MDRPTGHTPSSKDWEHAGRLLRGAAHEVNNQLGAILAYADLIALAPDCSADIAAMSKEIATAVRSGAAQINTVAALVSGDLATVETIQLNELLLRVSSLFRVELERAGSGADLDLPASECRFLGVRARIVRALSHALRHASAFLPSAPRSRRLCIRLAQIPGGYAIEIDGCEALGEDSASLTEAREQLAFHRGAVSVASPQRLRIEIPKDTGLKP